MNKLLTTALIVCSIGLVGCGEDPFEDVRCIRGVEYYDGYNTLAPAFKPDGTLYTCGESK